MRARMVGDEHPSSNPRHMALDKLLGQMGIVYSYCYYNKCQGQMACVKGWLAQGLEVSGYAR